MLNEERRMGGGASEMCDCCKPKVCEKGKDPKTCTPKQIKECHGDAPKHECAATAKSSK